MTPPTLSLTRSLDGRYTIERELGAGGMATVYLARDLRHERQVAIKVLHPDLAAALGAERFLQEIRTTANLQHPHILPLHDSGAAEGTVFYVMPYVEGESLRDRLARERQLPLADALRIATQVASALEYAHKKGVVHRDIKPENILLHDEAALVADFGIALAVQSAGGTRMTQTGLSLGTPQYMSPEQAMGERAIDARSDIYALGAVTYEMLTGEPPFTGATVQAIVAKVLTERPVPPSTVRDTVPAGVEHAVMTALAKLPADRFASAAAFGAALAQPAGASAPTTALRGAAAPAVRTWRRAALALGAVATVLAVTLAVTLGRSSGTGEAREAAVVRFEVPLPDSLRVNRVALSPDRSRLLLSSGKGVFVYEFASMRLTPLTIPGEGRISEADFSKDGTLVTFRADARLKVASLDGGRVRTLADSVYDYSLGDDGFAYLWSGNGGLSRIALSGGTVEALVAPDTGNNLGSYLRPLLLPGGREIIYGFWRYAPSQTELFVLDLASRRRAAVPLPMDGLAHPLALTPSGHLLLKVNDAVFAVRFDPRDPAAVGAPERLLTGLYGSGTFDVGTETYAAGTFAYLVPPSPSVAIVDRRGTQRRALPNLPETLEVASGMLSPDGTRLVLQAVDWSSQRQDLWTYRFPSGPLTRLTTANDVLYWGPNWMADGQHIAFVAARADSEVIASMRWDGSEPERTILRAPKGIVWGLSPFPDGKRFAYVAPGRGLVVADVDAPGDTGRLLVPQRLQPQAPRLSPDGRWIAYPANETGRTEVFVRSADGSPTRWQVSLSGGGAPRWSRDGRSLYFAARDTLFNATWSPNAEPRVGKETPLFALDRIATGRYDVLPRDTGFVMIVSDPDDHGRIVVVLNFDRELQALGGVRPADRR